VDRAAKKLEQFFLLFLWINPFLDIIGGVYITLAETFSLPSVTPSLLVRMGVLALFALYILLRRDWKSVLIMVPIGAAWALALLGQCRAFYSIDLMEDVQYIVRFAYNIAVILVYFLVFRYSDMTRGQLLGRINSAMTFTGTLLSGTIVLSYLLDIGASTYGDRFGFRGSKGFFYSGNDITAILMMLLPLLLCILFALPRDVKRGRKIYTAAAPALTVTALFLIGTKTAFLAVGGGCIAMLVYAVVMLLKHKDRLPLVRLCIAAVLFGVIFGGLMLLAPGDVVSDISASWNQVGVVVEDAGATNAIFSGRQVKLKKAFDLWKELNPYAAFFGIGRGTQSYVVEMDLFEVALYYGIFGTVAMLWLYLKLGVGFLARAFRRFDLWGLGLLMALGMTCGYLIIAGHVLFSVSSGFYFAFLLAYAYLYYAEEPQQLRIVGK